jgi:hypothetical protein
MNKYKIEGNIDFFNELYKSLDENEEISKTDDDDNKCLITNQPLIDKFVKLECGHKFNYLPLFNDIKNHKAKFNSMEASSTMLKLNEIRCPYCRKRQQTVLPYYEDLMLEKINGVNYNSSGENLGCNFVKNSCQFTYKIKYTDGGEKEYGCYSNYVYDCEDGKQYCFHHHNIIKKLLIKKQNQKIKEDIKNAKLEALNKAKEEKQKAKEELNKAKEEKKILKEELKKAKESLKKSKKEKNESTKIFNINNLENEENIIIEPLQQEQQYQQQICSELLKNGNKCTKNVHIEGLCKRHYNLKNKESNESNESKESNESNC